MHEGGTVHPKRARLPSTLFGSCDCLMFDMLSKWLPIRRSFLSGKVKHCGLLRPNPRVGYNRIQARAETALSSQDLDRRDNTNASTVVILLGRESAMGEDRNHLDQRVGSALWSGTGPDRTLHKHSWKGDSVA